MIARIADTALVLVALVPLAAHARAQTCVTPPSGLVGWWDVDTKSRDNVFNLVDRFGGPCGRMASYSVNTLEDLDVAGMVGTAFGLNGTNDSIEIPHSAALGQTTELSVEFWMKSTGAQIDPLFAPVDKSHGFPDFEGWVFQGDSSLGTIGFGYGDGSGFPSVATSVNVLDGTFHHLAVTFDANLAQDNLKFYVDGVLVDMLNTTAPIQVNTGEPLVIGSVWAGGGTPERHFNGIVDEVSVYDSELTSSEILAIFNAGSDGKCRPTDPPCTTVTGITNWWRAEGDFRDEVTGSTGQMIPDLDAEYFITGVAGQGFDVDGDDDWVNLGTEAGNFGTGDFSIEFWFMLDRIVDPEQILVEKWVDTQTPGGVPHAGWLIAYQSGPDPDQIVVNATEAGVGDLPIAAIQPSPPIQPCEWHHLAFTHDSGTYTTYFDGQPATSATVGTIPDVSTPLVDLKIGHRGNSTDTPGSTDTRDLDLDGALDELTLYDRALTPAEVQAVFDAGTGGKCLPVQVCAPTETALTAWWPGEGTAEDVHGTNDGSTVGSPAFGAAQVADGFTFDSADDGIQVPHDTALDVPVTGFTCEFWMTGNASQPSATDMGLYLLVDKSHGVVDSTGWAFQGDSTNETLSFTIGRGGAGTTDFATVTTSKTLLDDRFHHVAGTWDGTDIRLYVDGELQDTLAETTVANNTRDLWFGRWSTNTARSFTGQIDEVSLYDRALTQSELAAIALAGPLGKCVGGMPPVADAGGPYVEECQGASTAVLLDGSASFDPEGAMLTYLWSTDCPDAVFDDPQSATPTLLFPTGLGSRPSCTATLVVSDGVTSIPSIATVDIADTMPADVAVTCSETSLWPADHSLASIGLSVSVDDCDPTFSSIAEVEVWSDEPECSLTDLGPEDYCRRNLALRALTLLYDGTSCDEIGRRPRKEGIGQPEIACISDLSGESVVQVRVSNKRDADALGASVWFDGAVSPGDVIAARAANAGERKLDPVVFVHVFDLAGNQLQLVEFSTNCRNPLELGDKLGSFELVGVRPAAPLSSEGGNSECHAPDMKFESGCLNLRQERDPNQDGRVYLLVVRSTDKDGNSGYDYCTVTVPQLDTPESRADVAAEAQAVLDYLALNPGASPSSLGFLQHGTAVLTGGQQSGQTSSCNIGAPVITGFPTLSAPADQLYTYDATAFDPDGGMLFYSLPTKSSGMSIDGSGMFTWTPTMGQLGIHDVVVRVTDAAGAFDELSFQLVVPAEVNNPPVITTPPVQSGTEGVAYLYDVDATDADLDPIGYTLTQSPAGMAIDAMSGLVTWTPNGTQAGEHTIRVQADDGKGATDLQEYEIVVAEAINNDPTFTSSPGTAATSDAQYFYAATSDDLDGDTLVFSLATAPTGMGVGPSTGLVQWYPTRAQGGMHAVDLQIDDGRGGVVSQPWNITVTVPNTSPTVTSAAPTDPLRYEALFEHDVDAIDPEGDTPEYTLATFPTGMTIDPDSGLISWTPTSGQVGFHTVDIEVLDGLGGIGMQSFQLEVLDVPFGNVPPTISSTAPTAGTEGVLYSYDVIASDLDFDPLTYSLTAAPLGMVIGSANGEVRWTPSAVQSGMHPVTILVSDGNSGGNATESYSITVAEAINDPPVITTTAITQATATVLYSYDVDADDGDNDTLEFDLLQFPAGMTIDTMSGLIEWTPGVGLIDTMQTVEVEVDDLRGGIDTQLYSIEVGELVVDTTPPTVRILVSADPADINDMVTITVLADDDTAVTSRSLLVNSSPVTLDGMGVGTFSSPTPGIFTADATASDAESNVGNDSRTFLIVDPGLTGAPVASITAPLDGDSESEAFDVTGTADGAEFADYKLELAPLGTTEFLVLAEGTSPVVAGTLGNILPYRCLNDLYTLRLTVRALDGSVAMDSVDVELDVKAAAVGAYTVGFTDKTVNVGSIPVKVGRVYDSRRKTVGDFGLGWTLDYKAVEIIENRPMGEGWLQQVDTSGFFPTYLLEPLGKHEVVIRWGPNDVERFEPAANPPAQPLFPIRNLAGLDFQPIGFAEGQLFPLVSPVFVNPGSAGPVTLTNGGLQQYRPQQYIYEHPSGDSLAFTETHTGSLRYRLSSLTGHNSNTLFLSDDGILNSQGIGVTFERDADGRIERIVDPSGEELVYEYDVRGRLSGFVDELGNRVSYHYDESDQLVEVRDPLGRPSTRQEYDGNGLLVALVDADGNRYEITNDPVGREETFLDPDGNLERFVYDTDGNVTLQERTVTLDGVPTLHQTAFQYDSRGREIYRQDGDGLETTREYDGGGHLTAMTLDPNGYNLRTSYVYDTEGNLVSTTDPFGSTTSYTYDANGNRLSRTDALGTTTEFEYDGSGRLTVERDPLLVETLHTYSQAGQLTRVEVTDGGPALTATDFTYDALGRMATSTEHRTVRGVMTALTTTFEYDASGKTTALVDPLGNRTMFEYNALGRRTAVEDALGRRTTFEYDHRGLQTRTVFPDGLTATNTYDDQGRLVTQTDRGGRTTTFVHDEADRIIRTDFPDGTFTQVVYSLEGRILAEIDASGNRTDRTYDTAGRLMDTLLPATFDFVSGSTLRGMSSRAYDPAGRLASLTNARNETTSFTYDALGRLQFTTFPDGGLLESQYDANGRVATRIVRHGAMSDKATSFYYDSLGRMTQVVSPVVDAQADNVQDYTYDESGNLLTGPRITQEFDELGRIERRLLPEGQEESFAYDTVGRVVSHTFFDGSIETFQYDVMNRVTVHYLADGSVRTFTYTPTGNIATVTDSSGTVLRTYDAVDRIASFSDTLGQTAAYTYEARGRIETITTSGGVVTYGYDEAKRLESITSPMGMHDYERDLEGNVRRLVRPAGLETNYVYDAMNRLTSVVHDDGVGTIASFTQVRNLAGLPTSVTELDGTTIDFDYDDQNRLREVVETDPLLVTATNSYDYFGLDRTTADFNGETVSYGYDLNGRQETLSSSVSGLFDQVFDDTGRLLSIEQTSVPVQTYVYDALDRLRSFTDTGGTVTYGYDGLNSPTTRTDSTSITDFLVGENPTGLAQILETQDTVDGLTTFLYDDRGVLGSFSIGSDVQFLEDLRGSVVVRDDGVVTTHLGYDEYGRPDAPSGTTAAYHGYRGQWYDEDAGLYFLRARVYDPRRGEFLSRDPFGGLTSDPLSFDKYGYARGNPVVFEDPLGLFSLIDLNFAGSIRSTLRQSTSVAGYCRDLATAQSLSTAFGFVVAAGSAFSSIDTPQLKLFQIAFPFESKEYGLEGSVEISAGFEILKNQEQGKVWKASFGVKAGAGKSTNVGETNIDFENSEVGLPPATRGASGSGSVALSVLGPPPLKFEPGGRFQGSVTIWEQKGLCGITLFKLSASAGIGASYVGDATKTALGVLEDLIQVQVEAGPLEQTFSPGKMILQHILNDV